MSLNIRVVQTNFYILFFLSIKMKMLEYLFNFTSKFTHEYFQFDTTK